MSQRHTISTVLHHFVSAGLILGMVSQSVSAKPTLEPSTTPINGDMVDRAMCSSTTRGIKNTEIDQAGLTTPSLWWIRDQIAAQDKYGRRLVSGWLACEVAGEPNRVDVLVNAQLWSLLDFFDRYEFIEKFGTATTGYGYNLRVFEPEGGLLAAYTCNFSADVAQKQTPPKNLVCSSFDQFARTNFWSPTKPTLGF